MVVVMVAIRWAVGGRGCRHHCRVVIAMAYGCGGTVVPVRLWWVAVRIVYTLINISIVNKINLKLKKK